MQVSMRVLRYMWCEIENVSKSVFRAKHIIFVRTGKLQEDQDRPVGTI